MGVVFRARDTKLGREVALKCPWPHMSKDAVARHRFLREARATSRLAHPTIVPVYEVFEDRELPWIAMELVEGRRTLAESLVDGEPLPLDQILQHAEDLTDALRAAHTKGILHRDIKPSNVLVGTDGRVRLTDFGLARFIATADRSPEAPTDGASDVTEEGKVVGTIAYMAPEVLLGGVADPRSDLFSLGVIVYEMCTGRAAFLASSKYDVYELVLRREPPAIGRFNYEIPRSLERIVRKALAKRPDERYQDARDMLADVRAVRRRLASGVHDGEDDLDAGRARARWIWATWSLGALAALSVGVAAWLALHPSPKPAVLGTPHQVTTAPGAETEPAISPDGTLIAYSSDESGQFDIWLVDARGGNPLRLTRDPGAEREPAWFPDGTAIAFTAERDGKRSIQKVATLGGSMTMLVPDAATPAISPDASQIAFVREDEAGATRIEIMPLRSSASEGPIRRLTSSAVGLWQQSQPAWSPDGRSIAFADFARVWLADVSTGNARPVTDVSGPDSRPTWSADGRSIYFESFRGRTRALWKTSVEGGAPERLTYGSGPEGSPQVSRSGTSLVFSTLDDVPSLEVIDLESGAYARLGGRRGDSMPALFPNGDRLLFTSDEWGGADGIALQELDGVYPRGPARRLTDWAAAVPTVSPDGKWIACWRNIDGSRDLWLMSVEGGAAIRATDDPAPDIQPAWSPDGRAIAFVSERGKGSHIWVLPVANGRPTGPARQITRTAATDLMPEWSPDGRTIAFVRKVKGASEVWLIPASGGEARRLTSGAQAEMVVWRKSPGNMLVSGLWDGASYEIRRVEPESGRATSLVPRVVMGPDSVTALFDVDRLAHRMAIMRQERRGDVWVVEADHGRF